MTLKTLNDLELLELLYTVIVWYQKCKKKLKGAITFLQILCHLLKLQTLDQYSVTKVFSWSHHKCSLFYLLFLLKNS